MAEKLAAATSARGWPEDFHQPLATRLLSGEPIMLYLGIDLHRKQMTVSLRNQSGAFAQPISLPRKTERRIPCASLVRPAIVGLGTHDRIK
jgi:hypothetical protein